VGGGIEVTNAIVVFDDGHAGKGHNGFYQALAATGDDQVEPTVHLSQYRDAFAVGEGNQLDRMRGQPGRGTTGLEGLGNGAVGVDRLAATAQNRGVAGLETQHCGIRGDIRPAFVDDADGAYGHTDLFDAHAIGPLPRLDDLTDRIGQGGHLLDARSHGFNPRDIEPETVEHGRRQAAVTGCAHVLGIGGQQFRQGLTKRNGHRTQNGVFPPAGKLGKLISRSPGLTAHLVNRIVDGSGHGSEEEKHQIPNMKF